MQKPQFVGHFFGCVIFLRHQNLFVPPPPIPWEDECLYNHGSIIYTYSLIYFLNSVNQALRETLLCWLTLVFPLLITTAESRAKQTKVELKNP